MTRHGASWEASSKVEVSRGQLVRNLECRQRWELERSTWGPLSKRDLMRWPGENTKLPTCWSCHAWDQSLSPTLSSSLGPETSHREKHVENPDSTGSLPWDVLSPHRGSPSPASKAPAPRPTFFQLLHLPKLSCCGDWSRDTVAMTPTSPHTWAFVA